MMWCFLPPWTTHRATNRFLEPKTVRRYGYAIVIPLTVILLATIVVVASGQTFDLSRDVPQYPKLHFRLSALLNLESPPAPQKKGLIRIDAGGRVQVYIRAKPATQELLDQIKTHGGKIDRQRRGVIQAWVPIPSLELLAAFPEVKYIQPRIVKQLICPSDQSLPGPSEQISKQVSPNHHFSKPLKA